MAVVDGSDENTRILGNVCSVCGAHKAPEARICPNFDNHPAALADETLIGTRLADTYELLAVLGKGGMGVVYKARDLLRDRLVAVKMLHPHLTSDQQGVKRFQHEVRACRALEHPNVVQVHDSGITEDGRPYLVMTYIDGRSLGEVLEKEHSLEPERAILIFSQVCDALAHAHHKGVVHRDLKPNNIMLVASEASKDVVKIVDFGIAKLVAPDGTDTQTLTRTGETFGSPWYMSPEQCLAQRLDSRSDIYALGCVMYHALTGKPPLVGESAFETMTFHVSKKPRPFKSVRADLSVQPELERVVRVAMEKIPEERWQSMTEFRDQLLAASRQERVGTMGVATERMTAARLKPRGSKIRLIKVLLLVPTLVVIFAEVFKPGSVQRIAADGFIVCERLWERLVNR